MAKFLIREYIGGDLCTARFGTTSAQFADADKGKAVKLIGDSAFGLCSAGDPIEGFCVGLNSATADGYRIGSLQDDETKAVTYDGSEAAGTGTAAIGDYVVAGTQAALGTAMASYSGQKVRTATNQPGVAIVSTVGTADTAAAVKVQLDAVLAKQASQVKNSVYAWRIVSLGDVGTGAVGTQVVIERVNY